MLIYIVFLAEVLLAGSVFWLFYTLGRLLIQDKVIVLGAKAHRSQESSPHTKIKSLQQAQIFASTQLMHLKFHQVNLHRKQSNWLTRRVAFYLAGAGRQVARVSGLATGESSDLMRYLVSKNLKESDVNVEGMLTALSTNALDDQEAQAFKAGESAAREWLRSKKTSKPNALFTHVNEWGFVS